MHIRLHRHNIARTVGRLRGESAARLERVGLFVTAAQSFRADMRDVFSILVSAFRACGGNMRSISAAFCRFEENAVIILIFNQSVDKKIGTKPYMRAFA